MRKAAWAALAVPFAGLLVLLGSVVLLGGVSTAAGCGGGEPVTVRGLPTGPVAGYAGQQLAIAAQILNAGAAVGVDAHGQTIGVMVGMGESSLTNVGHGDAAGPDSIGVFQQRANGAWGSLADRTDPAVAAGNFFNALLAVPGWKSLEPTLAAHAVQRNADPWFYAPYWPRAQQVVAALARTHLQVVPPSGTPASGAEASSTPSTCDPSSVRSVPVGPGGWTRPAVGPLTSGFGWRAPTGASPAQFHQGQDVGAACASPIYAATSGRVVKAGPSSGFGNLIAVDHGGAVQTWYGHMWNDGVLVHVGDSVTAGQQIGTVGANGQATGCHLHFQVMVDGTAVDPVPFMAAHGAGL